MMDQSLASRVTRERDDYFGRFLHSHRELAFLVVERAGHLLIGILTTERDSVPPPAIGGQGIHVDGFVCGVDITLDVFEQIAARERLCGLDVDAAANRSHQCVSFPDNIDSRSDGRRDRVQLNGRMWDEWNIGF
jgi:hypothetical protein